MSYKLIILSTLIIVLCLPLESHAADILGILKKAGTAKKIVDNLSQVSQEASGILEGDAKVIENLDILEDLEMLLDMESLENLEILEAKEVAETITEEISDEEETENQE